MKIVGMMAARSESWILNLSIRAALEWCDELVFLNHQPDDATGDLLMALPNDLKKRINMVVDNDANWAEMRHRQIMIQVARDLGGTHLAICDADEIASIPLRAQLRSLAIELQPGEILAVPMVNLRGDFSRYHGNGIWGDRIVSVVWCDDKHCHYPSTDTLHHREPVGTRMKVMKCVPPVLHAWGVTERRLVARHWAYRVHERLKFSTKAVADIEAMYSMATVGPSWSQAATWRFESTPSEWITPAEIAMVDLTAVPWHEAWVTEIVKTHGQDYFAGLKIG